MYFGVRSSGALVVWVALSSVLGFGFVFGVLGVCPSPSLHTLTYPAVLVFACVCVTSVALVEFVNIYELVSRGGTARKKIPIYLIHRSHRCCSGFFLCVLYFPAVLQLFIIFYFSLSLTSYVQGQIVISFIGFH